MATRKKRKHVRLPATHRPFINIGEEPCRPDESLEALPTLIIESPDGFKMSEVLKSFVEPYLGAVEDEDTCRDLLSVAVLAWNLSLLPSHLRPAAIAESLAPITDPETRRLLEE